MRHSLQELTGLRESAPVFSALGDETRLRLVLRLCEQGPMSITKLVPGSGVTRQAITKHLLVMEQAGLVRGSRHGREKILELEKRRVEIAKGHLELISRRWDAALDRLRKSVEE